MKTTRFGFGYDVHRLAKNRKLILGGVTLKSERGLLGHSDADVLSHAIADSLLGAAALGDIGKHFPDTDKKWKNISSLVILKQVYLLIKKAKYKIVNIDSTVVLEKPKISPYINKIKINISKSLSIHISKLSIKATTNEKLGDIGKQKGAAAYAISSITKIK
ncbi:MAG: 2-C-methyl-D-erythritol 2,4-cyclodiphosphate synthase [Bacteroidetes bacterium]|nr:2-C-methyl-D-erythritol 2,4-cyclodiphosphate synthase [Bacteroidota bacterium]